jgi:phosphoglycerol transferase MdoB-like AlkP superfamily enzyme
MKHFAKLLASVAGAVLSIALLAFMQNLSIEANAILTFGAISVIGFLASTASAIFFFTKFVLEGKEKESLVDAEARFARALMATWHNFENAMQVVKAHRHKSIFAKAFSHSSINLPQLLEELHLHSSQKKIKNYISHLIESGREHHVLAVLLRHLMHHKKIPQHEAALIEAHLGHVLPKEDEIEKFYEAGKQI